MGPTRSHGTRSARLSAAPRDLMAPGEDTVGAWCARVVTLFPDLFPGILGASLTGKALATGLWRLETMDLRRFGIGRHRNVDDTPMGGGAGMVLRPDVLDAALRALGHGPGGALDGTPLIAPSPRGRPFTQARARALADGPGATFVCGRFEGIDERVIAAHGIEEISLGDFILTGGEIAATALIDATVRLIPHVLGNRASLEEESFAAGLLEHPQYTKPADWDGRKVPDILLSGNHGAIASWRRAQAERLTENRRPDLWRAYRAQHGGDPDGDREL